MICGTMHNHTTFCDGKNTVREMVLAAIDAGFTDFGISSHAREKTNPDTVQNEAQYVECVHAVRDEFSTKIRVYCGLEQDMLTPIVNPDALDYFIGSVHYVYSGNEDDNFCIDATPQIMREGIDRLFSGNGLAAAKRYFELVAQNAARFNPPIIGHFDLILKLNDGCRFFDENSSEYRAAALTALEECAKTDGVFEINTGGKFKGYRDFPYLQPFLLKRLCELNARVMINCDAHSTAAVAYFIPESMQLMRDAGFRELTVYENGRFVQKPL